jgi:hypothetical protein
VGPLTDPTDVPRTAGSLQHNDTSGAVAEMGHDTLQRTDTFDRRQVGHRNKEEAA